MNHIRVTLEFIPVEERLPEESGQYFVLDAGINMRNYSASFNHFSHRQPTHWAEIPEIAKEGG